MSNPQQQPYYPPQQPQYGYQAPPQQARSGAQYVRQQTGHSLTKLILLDWITLYMRTIYYACSPNHYFHA